MGFHASYALLFLSLLLSGAAALPGGCGGTLGILDIQSSDFNSLVWTCAGVDPSSLFMSGQNWLIASYVSTNASSCGNECAASWDLGLMAAIWFNENQTCECWQIGDISTGDLVPPTDPSRSVTFVDFYDLGVNAPSPTHNFGIFTCPEGSWSEVVPGEIGLCGYLTIIPAGPPLSQSGSEYCGEEDGIQYGISDSGYNFNCYGDLAGAKYYFNYSSPYILYDTYDFMTTSFTSTTTKASTKSTSIVKSTTRSSPKSKITSTSKLSKSKVTSTSKSSSKSKVTSTSKSFKSSVKSSSKSTVTSTAKSPKFSAKPSKSSAKSSKSSAKPSKSSAKPFSKSTSTLTSTSVSTRKPTSTHSSKSTSS